MKITNYIAVFFMVYAFFSYSQNVHHYQPSHNFAQEIGKSSIDPFMPIIFNPMGINSFLTSIYNRPDYGTEFLPNNFSHLLQFLQHGIDTQQGASYAQSVVKLFSNKIKSGSYVNAYVFNDMLGALGTILPHYMVTPKPRSPKKLQLSVNDVLYSSFLSQFDFFQRDSKKFFNTLSHDILTSLNYELSGSQKRMETEQLRQTVIRFLELCASKLIWSPEEPADIWQTVKNSSQALAHLLKVHVIEDIDHLDDLLWSITHRFCFFVDLTGADLPIPFYQNIKQDLIRNEPLLCKLEEQEKFIRSKADHIMQAALAGEAKARARESGIITY